jgi:hypothetical protein
MGESNLRIENLTHWRTDHLRALVARVAQEELDPKKRRTYKVVVGYNRGRGRGGYSSGHAMYHGSTAYVNVPTDVVDRVDFVHTVAHEIAHSRGMHHRMMSGSRRYNRVPEYREFYSWAAELPLERQVAPVKTRAKRLEVASASADKMVAKWTRRLKLAKTMLHKWERRRGRLVTRIGKEDATTGADTREETT